MKNQLILILFGLIATAGMAAAQGTVNFIPAQSSWRYQDNGQPCVDNWPRTNFNDSAWAIGVSQLGFGGDGEQTLLQSEHITYYFRHTFTATNAAAISNLQVRLKRDDGAILYLNGTEIFRSNMPTGRVDYLTMAAAATTGANETNIFLSPIITSSLLVNGANVVAVEVHQASANDGDLGFDLELTGNVPRPASLTLQVPPGWSTFANNFNIGSNTLNEVLPQVADGTEIYKWSFATQSYYSSLYDAFSGAWFPNLSLLPGDGAWIHSSIPQSINLTPQPGPPGLVARPPQAGLRFVSCRAPMSSTFDEILGFPPAEGDRMLFYEGSFTMIPSQPTRVFTFSNSAWSPTPPPLLEPGKAVFVDLAPQSGSQSITLGVTYTEACKDYASRPPGPVANPLEEDGVKITAINSGGLEFAAILDEIAGRVLARGYYVQNTVDMEFTPPCRSVRVDFFQLENPLVLTAYDDVGNIVAGPINSPGSAGPDGIARSLELTSAGNLIHRVVIGAPNALATIQRVCCQIPREGPCVFFPLTGEGRVANPLVTGGYTVTTLFHRDPDSPWFDNRIITMGSETGVRLAMFTDVRLGTPCPVLELSFRGSGSAMTVKTYDPTDALIETRTVSPPADPAMVVTLRGDIQRVALERSDTNAILTRICCKLDPQENGPQMGPFATLSHATFGVTPAGSLVLSNITSSGLDGLRVNLGVVPSVRLDFGESIPASNAPPGATFSITLRGRDYEALGLFAWTTLGDFWYPANWGSSLSSFQPIGSPTYTTRIYLGNQLVSESRGLREGVGVHSIPPQFVAEKLPDGQLRLGFDYGNAISLFRIPGLGDVAGTRIDWISERPQPSVPLDLRIMDLRWSGITFHPLLPTAQDCLVILTRDITVTCAGPDGANVYYTVVATNVCTHTIAPANCVPPSGSLFPLGQTLVTCVAGTANQRVFGAFHVTTTRDESGALIQNPGFELATPPPPPAGAPFGLSTVPGWTALTTEASLHGLGGLSACEGTNYAGLRAETVNGIFKYGVLEGRLTHPLAQGGAYQFMACIALTRGAGAWVEFVLSDGNPAHEQIITREFAEYLGSWQSLRRGVTIPVVPPEVPGVRFTASYPHDRILVRTIATFEGRASEGNVFVDDLRLGCFQGMIPGRTGPRGFSIRWTGDGVLQSSSTLGTNAPWTDANVTINHDGNSHEAIIPADGKSPMQFFRLRR